LLLNSELMTPEGKSEAISAQRVREMFWHQDRPAWWRDFRSTVVQLRDALAAALAPRQDDEDSSGHGSLHRSAWAVLQVMARFFPQRLTQVEIGEGCDPPLSRATVARHLNDLRGLGLSCSHPSGGEELTDEGRRVAAGGDATNEVIQT